MRFDGDHTGIGFGPDGTLTREALEAFLDAQLEGTLGPLRNLPAEVADSGLGDWRERNAPAA